MFGFGVWVWCWLAWCGVWVGVLYGICGVLIVWVFWLVFVGGCLGGFVFVGVVGVVLCGGCMTLEVVWIVWLFGLGLFGSLGLGLVCLYLIVGFVLGLVLGLGLVWGLRVGFIMMLFSVGVLFMGLVGFIICLVDIVGFRCCGLCFLCLIVL